LHSHPYSQSLEKFSGQTTLVAHHLEAFMRQIHDTEFPNSVEATEQLLIEQGTDYAKLKVRHERQLVIKGSINP
jgi:pleckstrin homology domain-containing family G member 4